MNCSCAERWRLTMIAASSTQPIQPNQKVVFQQLDNGWWYYVPSDTPDNLYPSRDMATSVALMEHGRLSSEPILNRRAKRRARLLALSQRQRYRYTDN